MSTEQSTTLPAVPAPTEKEFAAAFPNALLRHLVTLTVASPRWLAGVRDQAGVRRMLRMSPTEADALVDRVDELIAARLVEAEAHLTEFALAVIERVRKQEAECARINAISDHRLRGRPVPAEPGRNLVIPSLPFFEWADARWTLPLIEIQVAPAAAPQARVSKALAAFQRLGAKVNKFDQGWQHGGRVDYITGDDSVRVSGSSLNAVG